MIGGESFERIGMDPRSSLLEYPRLDSQYRTRGSLNFDLIRTKIYKERARTPNHDIMIYFIYTLIGIATGILTWCINAFTNEFTILKNQLNDNLIGEGGLVAASFFDMFISSGLAFIAAVLVVYFAPQAAGSGIPEMVGYLNGVNIPNFYGTQSLLIKVAAICLVGVSGLCVGKTGQFSYLGAMIGMAIIYLPISGFSYFHTDARKREFVSCGMACGMAAAFGAPIGGTLFGYEISQPNYFWEVQSTWRTFIACSISVVMYSLLQDIYIHGDFSEWVLDSATFDFSAVQYPTPTFGALPGALIIGATCGLLGALFVSINTYCGMFRREYMNYTSLRMVEVTVLALITTVFAFWLPNWVQAGCYSFFYGQEKSLVQYNCPNGYYSPFATLTMNSESLIIQNIVNGFN